MFERFCGQVAAAAAGAVLALLLALVAFGAWQEFRDLRSSIDSGPPNAKFLSEQVKAADQGAQKRLDELKRVVDQLATAGREDRLVSVQEKLTAIEARLEKLIPVEAGK